MPETEVAAGITEVEGSVAGTVVGHDPGHGDAEALVVGDGGLEKGDGATLLLVGQDLGEGEAGGVVDANVDELPANATGVALTSAVTGDPVADAIEAAELLDIDMD
jgi:hypothetical protein